MRPYLVLGALLILLGWGGVQLVRLHRANVALQLRLNERQTAKTVSPPRRQEPKVGHETASVAVTDEVRARLMRLRSEVVALEEKASASNAQNAELTDAPSTNRDPESGMTKLEYFRNVGQGTPAAALQTLFWAAMKGEDAAMARTLGWDDTARAKAQALIEGFPADLRARYATPEQLAVLFISKKALDVSAIHIVGTEMKDAANASLTVKGLTGGDAHLSMRLGPGGWQLSMGEGMLSALGSELLGRK